MEIGYHANQGIYRVQLTSDGHTTEHFLYRDALQSRDLGEVSRTIDLFVNDSIEDHVQSRPAKEVSLFSECVIGYRKWRLADWVLSPINHGSPWRPGVNKAVCQPDKTHFYLSNYNDAPMFGYHEAPGKNCNCGMNAFFEPKGIREGGDVLGAVVGWGDLQVHPDGFRAEYAQIVGLLRESVLNDSPNSLDLTEVSRLYDVPVVGSMEELQMEASEHGSPLPKSLRPAEQKGIEGNYASGGYLTAYNNALKSGYSSAVSSNPFSFSAGLMNKVKKRNAPQSH